MRSSDVKPKDEPDLLFVSHCVPQRFGEASHRAAWELLDRASHSHRLWLVALADCPVNLLHYRELAQRVEQIALVPRPGLGHRRRLRGQLEQLFRQRRFEAGLCTKPALWATVDAAATICGKRVEPWVQPPIETIVRTEMPLRQAA